MVAVDFSGNLVDLSQASICHNSENISQGIATDHVLILHNATTPYVLTKVTPVHSLYLPPPRIFLILSYHPINFLPSDFPFLCCKDRAFWNEIV
jgi:hypothetical protein